MGIEMEQRMYILRIERISDEWIKECIQNGLDAWLIM